MTISNSIFFIVNDGDFTEAELITLDSITPNPLSEARWALDRSAFIVSFDADSNPYPLMANHTAYTQTEILPIVNVAPWVMAF